MESVIGKTFFFLSPSLYVDILYDEVEENPIEEVTITGEEVYTFPFEETYYTLDNGMAYKVEDFHYELDEHYFGVATKPGYPKRRTVDFGFFTTKENAQAALNEAIEFHKNRKSLKIA